TVTVRQLRKLKDVDAVSVRLSEAFPTGLPQGRPVILPGLAAAVTRVARCSGHVLPPFQVPRPAPGTHRLEPAVARRGWPGPAVGLAASVGPAHAPALGTVPQPGAGYAACPGAGRCRTADLRYLAHRPG